MTAELHYPPKGGRHVLVDTASMSRPRQHAAPAAAYELTGVTGRLDAIPVYIDTCPCTNDAQPAGERS